jgi:hypothetical protein
VDELALIGHSLVRRFPTLEAVQSPSLVILGENGHHLEHTNGEGVAQVIEEPLGRDGAHEPMNAHKITDLKQRLGHV